MPVTWHATKIRDPDDFKETVLFNCMSLCFAMKHFGSNALDLQEEAH